MLDNSFLLIALFQVEHILEEKRVLAAVSNPFLVNLLGHMKDNANLYLVLDFVAGGELFHVLRGRGRFTEGVAKFYAAQVVLAFEVIFPNLLI